MQPRPGASRTRAHRTASGWTAWWRCHAGPTAITCSRRCSASRITPRPSAVPSSTPSLARAPAHPLPRPAPLRGDHPAGAGLRLWRTSRTSSATARSSLTSNTYGHVPEQRQRQWRGDGRGVGWVDPPPVDDGQPRVGPRICIPEGPQALRHAPRDRYANLQFGYGAGCPGGRADPPRSRCRGVRCDTRPGPRDTLHDWRWFPARGAGTT